MAANPALASANSSIVQEALIRLDFLVVADIFMTKNAELVDIVHGPAHFLRRPGLLPTIHMQITGGTALRELLSVRAL